MVCAMAFSRLGPEVGLSARSGAGLALAGAPGQRSSGSLLDHCAHLLARERAHRLRADVALGAEGQQRGRRRLIVGSLDHADDVVLSEGPIDIYETDAELLELLLGGSSYEADFAASWGMKARDILDQCGQALFGVRLNRGSKAARRWDLAGHKGGMVSAGVGGPITGKGAHLLVIDDPLKNAEQAMSEVIRAKQWEGGFLRQKSA